MFGDVKEIEAVLLALAEQLEAAGVRRLEIVVCGGAALNILGFVKRTTKDVDIMAFVDESPSGITVLTKESPLKPSLDIASKRVQEDFNLPDNWINTGPASVVDFGLPQGLMDRAQMRVYGKNLIIHFLSRYDQIHFKLYAAVDQSGGRHLDDLLKLKPSSEEIEAASRWSMTHDVSEGYKEALKYFLNKIGFQNVADKL